MPKACCGMREPVIGVLVGEIACLRCFGRNRVHGGRRVCSNAAGIKDHRPDLSVIRLRITTFYLLLRQPFDSGVVAYQRVSRPVVRLSALYTVSDFFTADFDDRNSYALLV